MAEQLVVERVGGQAPKGAIRGTWMRRTSQHRGTQLAPKGQPAGPAHARLTVPTFGAATNPIGCLRTRSGSARPCGIPMGTLQVPSGIRVRPVGTQSPRFPDRSTDCSILGLERRLRLDAVPRPGDRRRSRPRFVTTRHVEKSGETSALGSSISFSNAEEAAGDAERSGLPRKPRPWTLVQVWQFLAKSSPPRSGRRSARGGAGTS